MDAQSQRPVRRTYGKPKPTTLDASEIPHQREAQRKPDTEDEATHSNSAVSEGTPEDKTTSSSPLDDAGAAVGREAVVWDGLRKGKGADWRRVLDDGDEEEDEDPIDEAAEAGDAYEQAKRAIMAKPKAPTTETNVEASSSLPPLTSEDPLALGPEHEDSHTPEEEMETMPVKPRRRAIKSTPTSQASSSSGSDHDDVNPTPTRRRQGGRRTPKSTTVRRTFGTEDAEVALPSSQPEYQRLVDRAEEKAERKRVRREAREVADAGREIEDPDGLQTSPLSPTLLRGTTEKRRRRKVVAASSEESSHDEKTPRRRESTHTAKKNRPRIAASETPPPPPERGIESEDDDEGSDGGFKKTMGKMFERPKSPSPVPEVEPGPEREDTPEKEGRTTRRKGKGKAVRRVDDGSSSDSAPGTKKPKIKSLSKKEKQEMSRQTAQMRAGKEVHLARVSKQFSVAGFITASVSALSAKIPFRPISQQVSAVPSLVHSRAEAPTQSSAVAPTPDSEIGQYSSQQRPLEVHERQRVDATPTKGPTVVQSKTARISKPVAPLVIGLDDSDSGSDDDDGLKAILKLKATVQAAGDEEKRRLAFEEKQKVLKARKEAAVKAQTDAEQATRLAGTAVVARSGKVELGKSSFLKGVSRPRQDLQEIDMDDSDADDDLEILDTPVVKPATRKPGQRLNPKDMLDVKREQGGAKSRNGGGRLQFAPRQEVTESMFQHAGQTFDQAGKRQREGTAAKADGMGGAGSNKLAPITTQQSFAFLMEQQRRMAAEERQRKEKESGLKSRALQPRREQLIDEATLEETRKAEERRLALGADEEVDVAADDDDDSEDGDFSPGAENDEDEADADVDMEDRVLVQETQDAGIPAPQDVEMADDRTPEAEDANMQVVPEADSLEETEEALRQRKRKRQAVLDSDDEEESARTVTRISPPTKRVEFSSEGVPESSLLSRKVSEPSAAPAPLSFGGGLDDFAGGFGSGGLSQFFGATQAPGAAGSATQVNGSDKGLDALRQGTPAAGHLAFGNLGAVVSATAQERNLALFGAGAGADAHSGYTPRPPQRQYLNSQGLFTQTTPKLNVLQGQESINLDDESMPFHRDTAISSEHEDPLLEPTYRSNHASSLQNDPDQQEETSTPLSRLKRRREEEDEEVTPLQPEESEVELPMPNEEVNLEEEEIALPSSQPEQSPRSRPQADVFQQMMADAQRPPTRIRPKANPDAAKEFVDGEAELDLEENDAFYNRLGDEDDDAEGDGVVENLVDDAERSKEQEIEDAKRRAEIDREYAEAEDARRQKIAQEVIEGKYKGKRRDGLDGVISSDDEDDEDKRQAKRKWRQLLKKRAIGEDLEELAQGETKAFVDAYQGGIASDDSDDDVEFSQEQPAMEERDAKDDDEAEDAPIVRNKRPIGIREIEDQVRLMAQQNREREEAMQDEPIEIDSLPPPYVDSDTDQEESQITISRRRDDQSFRKESNGDMSKFQRWAAVPDNNDSRRAGAKSAVTGGTSSSRSLGRNGTSNRSGSFATAAAVGKKTDKAIRPRASAVMGGVMAKKNGFTDGP